MTSIQPMMGMGKCSRRTLLLDLTLENCANQSSDLIQKVPLLDPYGLLKDLHAPIPN